MLIGERGRLTCVSKTSFDAAACGSSLSTCHSGAIWARYTSISKLLLGLRRQESMSSAQFSNTTRAAALLVREEVMAEKTLSEANKATLSPIAQHFFALDQVVSTMPVEQAEALLAAAYSCTPYNCWWAEYRAAQWLKDVLPPKIAGMRALQPAFNATANA